MESPGLAFAWFPSGEFEAALEHWPDLMDEPITDHTEYCVYIEGCLRDYAAAGGHDLVVAPLSVTGLVAWSEEHGCDPGSADARAAYAAALASRGEGLAWPPGRNDRCWCGSGQRYKWCCARAVSG